MASNIEKSPFAEVIELVAGMNLTFWAGDECENLQLVIEDHIEEQFGDHDGWLADAILDPTNPCFELKITTDHLKVDLKLCLVNSLGELRGTGPIERRDPEGDKWETVRKFSDEVLRRYAPAVGEVAGSMIPHPAVVDSATFGNSRPDGTRITRIFVDDHERLLTNVGQMVKKTIFAGYPDLIVNIMASVGEHDREGRGLYGHPASMWFNVFVGYYQIDAPKSGWKRPFGYHSAKAHHSQVNFEDLMRLGKSDWNYFSNWMYGVPADRIAPHDEINVYEAHCSQEPAQIRSKLWHLVELSNWSVVTAYESDQPGAGDLRENSVLTPLWRQAFGQPNPHPKWTKSFIPNKLATKFYMSYFEDDESYHTVIFGGSSPADRDPDKVSRFLDVQLATCKEVIEEHYRGLGF